MGGAGIEQGLIKREVSTVPTTLRWLIENSSLENLRCLACCEKLDTPIKSVNVLDNPDVVKWIKPGELVLSSGYFLFDDEQLQRQLIRDLRQAGCAALCIKTKRFFQTIPDAMVEESSAVGLPLIELPFFYSFSDVGRVIYRRIFLQSARRSRRGQQLLAAVSGAYFSGDSLSGMLSVFAQYYGRPVLLLDHTGACLGTAGTQEPGSLRKLTPFTMPASGEVLSLSPDSRPRLFFCVMLPGGFGGLFLPEDSAHSLRDELTALQHAASLVSLKLDQDHRCSLLAGEQADGFLHMLTASPHELSEDEIQHICEIHRFDCQSKRICITMWPRPERGSENALSSAAKALGICLGEFCTQAEPPMEYFLCSDRRRCAAFLLVSPHTSNPALMQLARDALGRFSRSIGAESFSRLLIGVGHCHQSISTLPYALEECQTVVRLMGKIFPEKNVFTAGTAAVYTFLNQLSPEEMRQIYLDTIAVLAEFDHANGTELLHTLSVFFSCQFNIAQAAKQLFIHRNTMIYRIEKIKAILHCNMRNIDEIMTIYLGLCVSEMLN